MPDRGVYASVDHDRSPDWAQIPSLYDALGRVTPGPVVTLNRAVAVAMVHGPQAGLAVLAPLEQDDRMTQGHRLDAVRAHLLEMAGELEGARAAYQRAARRTASLPERHSLRAARLTE